MATSLCLAFHSALDRQILIAVRLVKNYYQNELLDNNYAKVRPSVMLTVTCLQQNGSYFW